MRKAKEKYEIRNASPRNGKKKKSRRMKIKWRTRMRIMKWLKVQTA